MKTKLLFLILIIFISACTAPPDNAQRAEVEDQGEVIEESFDSLVKKPYNSEKSFFEFEGFGPGKSHKGTFNQGEMFFYYNEAGDLVKLEGTINTASVKSDSSGLDKHLMNEDFFNVNIFPEIKAVSTNIGENEITGELTFLGVTKEITFPAVITKNSVEADFVFDTTLFGLNYAGVNTEVRIAFKFVATE